MSFTDVVRGQGSFVSRTKEIDRDTAESADRLVKRVSPGDIFEPTGSNYSTSSMVVSQSSVVVASPSTRFDANLPDGGSLDGLGMETGRLYNISLSFVSSSISGSTVDLYR